MDCAYGQVRVRRCELGISGLERCGAAKLAKTGFRAVKNILETPAGAVLLVLTLRERRNSEKTRTKKRKKPRNFSVHDVPTLQDETHLCCKQGQSRECPSGSKRVLHRLQLRTNYPAVGKQTDGFDALRVAHSLPQESHSRAPAFPILVRLIQRTRQQPSVARIVAWVSLPALDCKRSRIRCLKESIRAILQGSWNAGSSRQ